jgi:hypothetical protein
VRIAEIFRRGKFPVTGSPPPHPFGGAGGTFAVVDGVPNPRPDWSPSGAIRASPAYVQRARMSGHGGQNRGPSGTIGPIVAVIKVYVSDAEREEISGRAHDARMSMAEYVRRALFERRPAPGEAQRSRPHREKKVRAPSEPDDEPLPPMPLPKIAPRERRW